MEKSKKNKHVVCNKDNKDNNVDNGVDNGENGVDDDDNDDEICDDGTDKHLTHLSQAAEYCLMERNKQNKH
eukprot:12105821-Ditylum_brightwellii.AAC.1